MPSEAEVSPGRPTLETLDFINNQGFFNLRFISINSHKNNCALEILARRHEKESFIEGHCKGVGCLRSNGILCAYRKKG